MLCTGSCAPAEADRSSAKACRGRHCGQSLHSQQNMHSRMSSTEATGLEEKAEGWSPSALCRRFGGSHQHLQEKGAADCLSEHSEASSAMAEPNWQQAPAGKLKKTAFKLFGGKRSICTLPNFFGGKSKSQGKGASKKGLSKSKTHDGISDVGYEGANAEHLRSPSDGGAEFPPPQLPSSQSALLATEAGLRSGFPQQSASLSGSSEGFEKKPGGDRSLFIARPKKGLKGLFNSIRRHRKNKTARMERTELQECASTALVVAEEQAPTDRRVGVDTQQPSTKVSLKSTGLPPERGGNAHHNASPDASLGGSRETDLLVVIQSHSGEAVMETPSSEGSQDANLDIDGALCASSAYGGCPDALQAQYLDSDPPSVPSGDQLSLMFGDVTSLKSFDSLTGCGDIIAEPDIDSIVEGPASAERSRDPAKRSSCLVTYQGGGEEMAVPDEVEEYLQQVWEGAIKAEHASYEPRLPELLTNCELQGVNGSEADAHLYAEGTRSGEELLTPHSDQQESAPNSDEGYYDSTTPGPEDEAGDGLEEMKKDRLPRDSYSGDALYEFYEPDDTLMSPSHGDESWFDRKVSPPEIFGQFLDFALPDEKDFVRMMGRKSGVMETEEERLATIQNQLLYWELQREPFLKHLDMLSKDQHPREKQHVECQTRVANVSGPSPSCLGCEAALPRSVESTQNAEKRPWKDYQEGLSPDKHYSGSSCLLQLMGNGALLDSDPKRSMLESCALSSLALEKPVTYPFYRMHGCHSCPPHEHPNRAEAGFKEPPRDDPCEPERVVSFSQALVDFASSGTLFSSLSESLGSSDSGSAFTQNLPALPTMVAFDIVDVEQEGEGECEQQLEMNADEETMASFEAFDGSYIPKESFAECDERMFPGYAPSSFQSCNWGVASLPRCLRLQEVSPPAPEPLSICRRSRSLDTESLAFELASLQFSKNDFKPRELWSKWSGCRKEDPVGQEDTGSSPEERESNGVLSWPALQNVPYGEDFSSQDVNPWDGHPSVPAFQSTWGSLEQPDTEPSFGSLAQSSSKGTVGMPQNGEANSPMLQAPRPMARPCNLPLQAPIVGSSETSAFRRHGEDSLAKKLAWVLPLGDKTPDLPPAFPFAASPDKPAICNPMGIAQGAPQPHPSSSEAFKDEAEHCKSFGADLQKGRAAHWNTTQQSATMNVTLAK